MTDAQVLCIGRDDVKNASIILNVTKHRDQALDVTLVATEGEAPYIVKCQYSQVHPPTI